MKKKFFFIISLVLFSGFIFAQQKKDTLLWFVGTWEGKTFKIDSALSGGSKGGTVTKKQDGSFKISTPGNKEWDKRLESQVKNIEKEKQQITDAIKNDQGMIQYNFGAAIKKELDATKESFKNYKTDGAEENNGTGKAPVIFHAQDKTIGGPMAPVENEINSTNWCTEKRGQYDEIVNFAKQHKKDRQFNLPPPPVADYDCWGCDAEKRQQYEKAVNDYIIDFFKEENRLGSEAVDILKGLALLPDENSGMSPSKGEPDCRYMKEYDLSEALNIIVDRGARRAEQLFKENRKNFAVLNPVIKVYLSALQQAQFMGLRGSDESVFLEIAGSLRDFYEHMRDKMIKEKDYSQMVNIPFMVGLLCQIQLCGDNSLSNDWSTLLDFCHFKLTYEMDAKVGKATENDKAYAIAHFKGTANVVPDLDAAGCLKFALAREEQQNIHIDLITNQVIAKERPVYVGTKKGKSLMPDIKLHFCKKDIDTIAFRYSEPDGVGLWNYPGGRQLKGWLQASEGIFKNADELKSDATDLGQRAQAIAADMKVNEDDIKKKVAELQKSGKSPQQMAQEIKKLMSSSQAAMPTKMSDLGKVIFLVNVRNRNKVLVDQKFDAREMNPTMNDVIVYGYMNIKLEHDPKK